MRSDYVPFSDNEEFINPALTFMVLQSTSFDIHKGYNQVHVERKH
jgi:hypothetical protein